MTKNSLLSQSKVAPPKGDSLTMAIQEMQARKNPRLAARLEIEARQEIQAVPAEVPKVNGFELAKETIAKKSACTDFREILMLIPQCFENVVKIDVEKDNERFMNATVRKNNVLAFIDPVESDYITSSVHNKATVNFKAGEEVYALKISTYKPLALKHASEDREQAKSEVRELFKAHIIPMLKASLVAADPLTVLQKEGEFTKALASYEREFVENGKNFSIVLVDIDGLKQINFDHSYAAGDTVLADLAHVLRNNLRVREDSSDKIFRLQKEEFAIIVNEQFEVAAEIAERLRTAVMANPFKLEYPLLGALNNAGEKPVVTCSFGVVDAKDVSKDSNSDIAEKMVLLAKEYLLEAKEPEIDGKGKPVEDSRGNKVCPQPIRLPEHLGNVINI